MKKLLLIFFLFIKNVNAQTYYGQFSEYKESRDYVEENDTTIVEKIDNTKYYKEERIYDIYYVEGQNNPLFPYIDKSRYYTEEFWTYDVPEDLPNREINITTYYRYTYMYPIRYIFLYDLVKKDDQFEIDNISISDNSQNVSFLLYKNSNLFFPTSIILNENDILMIDLKTLYALDNLEITINFKNEVEKFSIKIQDEREFYSDPFISQTFYNVQGMNNLKFEDFNVIAPKGVTSEYTTELKTDLAKTTMVTEMYYYNVIDYKYAYYNIEKKYVLEEDEDTIKEEDIIYKYKTRDKMTIADEIIIENYHTSLESFVDATGNVEIIDNIDYLKNGEYDVIFRLNDLEVMKKVRVNIESNIVLEDENKDNIKIIGNLEDKVEELNYEVNKKDIEIKEIMKNNIDEVNTLNNQIESLDYLLEENNKKIDLEVDSNGYDNKRILFIFILVIVLLLLQKIYKEKYN